MRPRRNGHRRPPYSGKIRLPCRYWWSEHSDEQAAVCVGGDDRCRRRLMEAAPVGDAQAGAARQSPARMPWHGWQPPSPEWPSLAGQSADYVYRQTVFHDRDRINVLMDVRGGPEQPGHCRYLRPLRHPGDHPGVADDSIEGLDPPMPASANHLPRRRAGKRRAGLPGCHGDRTRHPRRRHPAVAGQHAVQRLSTPASTMATRMIPAPSW